MSTGAAPAAQPARVLLGVSGGIAAYKSAELVRRLGERGYEVRCALTRSAAAFVTPLTLEVLTGHPVFQEEYLGAGPGGAGGEEAHIAAARWAGALCIAPATAHLLARLALGLADDFLTTTALAFTGPVVLAPAMHTAMWQHPTVQEHVDELRRRGVRLVGPVEGPLASGEVGMGRMAEPEAIAREVEQALGGGRMRGLRVLVTAGPTHEPLDPVRYLGNRSSGKMGFALAREAARQGAQVTLVAGPVALPTPPGVTRIDVTSTREMEQAVQAEAPGADLVIMSAAVADFRPRQVAGEKIKRSRLPPGGLSLELEENPDILAGLGRTLRGGAVPGPLLVGFVAETEELEAHARAKLQAKGVDFLVANDVSRRDIAFGSDANEVTVFRHGGPPLFLARRPKGELASALLDLFVEGLHERGRLPALAGSPALPA